MKNVNADQGNLKYFGKTNIFLDNFFKTQISELPEDEGGITYTKAMMNTAYEINVHEKKINHVCFAWPASFRLMKSCTPLQIPLSNKLMKVVSKLYIDLIHLS